MLKSRLFAIIGAILLLAVIAGGVVFIWPQYQTYLDAKQQLAVKNAQLAQKQEYFSGLAATDSKLEDYKDQLAKIDSALPLSKDLEQSLVALSMFYMKSAAENGLLVETLGTPSVSQPETGSSVGRITTSVSMKGNYAALKNFLMAIYGNSRIVETESIKFADSDRVMGGNDKMFSFGLSLMARYHASSAY